MYSMSLLLILLLLQLSLKSMLNQSQYTKIYYLIEHFSKCITFFFVSNSINNKYQNISYFLECYKYFS